MRSSVCVQGLMDGRTAKNSLGSVTFSAKYTSLVDTIGSIWSSNCGKILWSFSVIFGMCVLRGLADLLFRFFACNKTGRDVVSSALRLLLEINSMDADLSRRCFVLEAYKPEKFSCAKWLFMIGFSQSSFWAVSISCTCSALKSVSNAKCSQWWCWASL